MGRAGIERNAISRDFPLSCGVSRLPARGAPRRVKSSSFKPIANDTHAEPGTPWDLGHVDGTERKVYSGPEHRSCNRQTTYHRLRKVSRRW
jgi:hypothetical protein